MMNKFMHSKQKNIVGLNIFFLSFFLYDIRVLHPVYSD